MLYFIFCKSELLLLQHEDGTYTIPTDDTLPITIPQDVIIHRITPMPDGTEVRTCVITDPHLARHEVALAKARTSSTEEEGTHLPATSISWQALRQAGHLIAHDLYLKAGKCWEINYWDSQTQYCGCCGAPMQLHTDISKVCTKCGREIWPLLATAVIVLIHRGDEVLLVRARNFRGNHYGLVAGFVETGETLEEAVVREVREEVGLEISNLRYFGSQPWPYPCGLMVGYNADYVSGTITLQEEELRCADWFRRDNLPPIPDKLSIARRLIDTWLGSDADL